jgi:MFS family permease
MVSEFRITPHFWVYLSPSLIRVTLQSHLLVLILQLPLMADDQLKQDEPLDRVSYSVFTSRQKALIVGIVSTAATFSGFASNMYFPAIPNIAANLSVSTELINLTVTSYMVFQALSPTLWGAFSDLRGRRITYICTFVVFLGACVGLAETTHFYQLLILRCLQSTGSASTVAVGAGVIGDITTREERGGYMGVFQAGILVPLALGPVLGGLFSGTLGWRWIFWFLTVYGGAFLVVLILFLPETLRSVVGNGDRPATGLQQPLFAYICRFMQHHNSVAAQERSTLDSSAKKATLNLLGPLRILFGLEVILVIVFLSIYYTVWQMTIAAMSTFFARAYGLNEIEIGLTFIANGVGCIMGTLLTGKLLNVDYRRTKKQFIGNSEVFSLERARLRTIWLWAGLQCASSLVFGWTLDRRVHISVPIICTFFLGWAATSIQGVITTYLVDVFPNRGASATAALNLARCLLGASGTAAVLPLSNRIGVGWAFTLLTGIMVLSTSLVVTQMWYAPGWRRKREELEAAR